MRDAESIDIALKAAETGHVVFSTVHTTDAVKTINRIVSVFPAEEQKAARLRLAESLAAIPAGGGPLAVICNSGYRSLQPAQVWLLRPEQAVIWRR